MVPGPPGGKAEHRASPGIGIDEAYSVYRSLAMFEMAFEVQFGLHMAFLRTFAVPSIARVLVSTGEIKARPMKRSMDTGLFMYELIEAGPDSERGRAVVRRLNQMHKQLPIGGDEYSYALLTFIVPAVRWIDQFGWRPTTEREKEAITLFYARVGQLMSVPWVPGSYSAATEFFDAYEAEHLGPSTEGALLAQVTGGVLASRLPRGFGWASAPLTSLMLDDRLCRALSLPTPPPWQRVAFGWLMRARAVVARHKGPRKEPRFTPGKSGSGVYPHGYELEDLGPSR